MPTETVLRRRGKSASWKQAMAPSFACVWLRIHGTSFVWRARTTCGLPSRRWMHLHVDETYLFVQVGHAARSKHFSWMLSHLPSLSTCETSLSTFDACAIPTRHVHLHDLPSLAEEDPLSLPLHPLRVSSRTVRERRGVPFRLLPSRGKRLPLAMADGAPVRVEEGDTVWSIARRWDVDVESLKEANGIGKDSWLVAGSVLQLPKGGGRAEHRNEEAETKPKLRPGDLRVHVREGDTLWDISRRVDVPVDDLVQACGGTTVIQPGQDILVPRQLRLRPVSGKVNRPKPPEEGHEPFFHEFHITKTIEEMREEPHMQKLMRALQTVETSNMWPPPRGDDGTSIGPLQISQLYHADAWELDRTARKKGYYECELDLDHSEHTCLKYWMRWCPWALKFGDFETLARVHNGGPSYHLAPKTRKYWKKVKGELKSYDFKLNPRLRDWHAAKVRQETLGQSYVPLEARTLFAVDMTGLLTTALPPLRRLTGNPDA